MDVDAIENSKKALTSHELIAFSFETLKCTEGVALMTAAYATPDTKLNRALELVGSIDPEIADSYSSLEERILAQALENVELAERRLREIQELMGDLSAVLV